MSARGKTSERGAVLLTTLLVMSIMAVVAVEMLDDVRFGVRRTATVQDAAQADAYALAAQDFAQTYLEAQLKTIDAKTLTQYLRARPQSVLPFEGGTMILTLTDRGSCVSMGELSGEAGRRRFQRLLTALGVSNQDASDLTAVAADWVDADSEALPGGAEDYDYLAAQPPYRTANTDMQSITELRALKGMDEALYQALRPFVCARAQDAPSGINVNSLSLEQAPVLAAFLGDTALPQARMVLNSSSGTNFTAETFASAPGLAGLETKDADFGALTYDTNLIGIEAQIVYQSVTRVLVMEFEIKDGTATLLSRRYGDESRFVLPRPAQNPEKDPAKDSAQ